MKHSWRPAICVALPLLLGSCTDNYALVTVERDGVFLFQPRDAHGSGCLFNFTVRAASGEVMWEFDAPAYAAPPCANRFPLAYGVAPAGIADTVKAKPLQSGVVYRVEGWDGDNYHGQFRFKRLIVVDNMPDPKPG